MRLELSTLTLVVFIFAHMSEISRAGDFVIRADSPDHVTDFSTKVGCRYLQRVTSEYFMIRCSESKARSNSKTGTLEETILNEAKKFPNTIKEIEFQKLHKNYPRTIVNDPEWNKMWNLDITKSFDVTKNVSDLSQTSSENSHGTQVTGLLAAEANNNLCIVGVAHQSTVIGIKLLDYKENGDGTEALSLNYRFDDVDIYTNSWGPIDKVGYNGPARVTESAIRDGITKGRNGKGCIYVWAAGNGQLSDNCNADGYVNSIYTIPITSVDADGKAADYAEFCAPVFAATYAGNGHKDLISTSSSSSCIDGLRGTSFSAPLAAGMIALALETNSNLTWRDVQHLVVETSKRHNIQDGRFTNSYWQINGAGFNVSQVLGFGLMDAEELVTRAKTWVSVPEQVSCSTSEFYVDKSTDTKESEVCSRQEIKCKIDSLEHVKVEVSFFYSRMRGNVILYLQSPANTVSYLMTARPTDSERYTEQGSLSWNFTSVTFWGEKVDGTWKLTARSNDKYFTQVTLSSWRIQFYGFEKVKDDVVDYSVSTTEQFHGNPETLEPKPNKAPTYTIPTKTTDNSCTRSELPEDP